MVKVRLTGPAWEDYLRNEGSDLVRDDVVNATVTSLGWDAENVDGTYIGTIYADPNHGYAGQEVFEMDEVSLTGDVVNHPTHYTSDPSGVECIQITRHRNFNVGNAIKYLWRNGLKDDPGQLAIDKQVEDLRKAVFYIEDEIERLTAQ